MRPFLCLVLGCLLAVVLLASCREAPAPDASPREGAETASGAQNAEAGHEDGQTAEASTRSAPLYPAKEIVEAPSFTLPTLDGPPFSLSDHLGEVVVLNAWATWCGPCRQEIPDFIALQDEFGARGLLFVGVSIDEGGAEQVRPFAEEMGFNYPVVLDDGSVEAAYGPFMVVPTTYVLGRDGTVRYYAPGLLTRDTLRPVLQALLEEPLP